MQDVELSEGGEVGGCFFWEVCNAGVSQGFALGCEESLGDVSELVGVIQGSGEGGHCDLCVFCHEGVDPQPCLGGGPVDCGVGEASG